MIRLTNSRQMAIWLTRSMSTALLIALTLVQGCTVMQAAQYATARYCYLPTEVRTLNREAVALAVAPNRISIQCAVGQ